MKEAYKRADGKKVEGKRVVVDVERGRTVPNWYALQGMCHWMHIAHVVSNMPPGRYQLSCSTSFRSSLLVVICALGLVTGMYFIYAPLELQFI